MNRILNKKYFFLIFLTAMTASACKKVITVNLKDAAPQIVIEGNITNEARPYIVTIAKSVDFTQDNVYPPVTGATVTIKDDSTGITDMLSELPNGVYSSNATKGDIGHTYHLTVIANGKTYTAASTMPAQVLLDSITFQTNAAFGNSVTNALPNFQDPSGVYNAYQFVQSINGKLSKQLYVFDDRLSDGRYISRQLFNDSAYIQKGDTIQLEMQCLDKPVYSYFKELAGLDPTNGQPTSPANPISNINNGALGYFSAHTVQIKKAVFK
ncbi:DUF4249 domain-containing protein [Parasediminibacterium sp. JCM 36343]|uniref:DUF4249 domain-containing protein n=1 Tax=Parasediminibacterium sp. JCM 36343 TaxID=3374279 RepID=UPI00397DF54C